MIKLYKYRTFGVNTLRMLCESEVFFSDPSKFNDPLDCSPTLTMDVDLQTVEKLCHRMIANISDKEKADKEILNCRYNSTEYGDYKTDKQAELYYSEMLVNKIKYLLDLLIKSRGVLSMSGQWNSPLMWSHYADEHKGICIEYDVTSFEYDDPKKIDYKDGRGILVSSVVDWVFNKSVSAVAEIEYKYFYTKAEQWEYEDEWRYIADSQGKQSTPFQTTAIYFGMRCDYSVISSIVKLMNGSQSNLKFYKIYARQNSFELSRSEIDTCEIEACTPRPSVAEMFGDFKA